jgi:2-polyprenyl-3-methyl-5-hydroxy-6-metoxy-1,4-benzoquinol methylase
MLDERRDTCEIMDDPALPPATYRAVLADLASVNRVTLAQRPTLDFLRRAVGTRREFSLLDVGFGHGDMLRAIAAWARKRGIAARLVGIDLNPGSAPAAIAATDPQLGIDYRTGNYHDLAPGFDLIVSSLVAHHMTRTELLAFLRFMESSATTGWFINDLHRHALSYYGYPLLAQVMGWHPIVRLDGQTSIARSFRPPEWRALLGEAGVAGARVERYFPFRLCVTRLR